MSKKFRDFLFWFFVFIFIIVTSILSLYASGYKFNLSWPPNFNRLLVKTGTLALDSNPKNALVYLDGDLLLQNSWRPWSKNYLSTPVKIKNLLPGEYEVTIEKSGYWPFQKKINISSGQTTFLEDVSLFKADNPSIKAVFGENELKEKSFLISNDKKYIFLSDEKKIINLENGEERDLLLTIPEIKNISQDNFVWCKNNFLFVQGIFFSPEKNKDDQNYLSLIGEKANKWKMGNSENKLYYQSDSSLNYFDVNQKKVISIFDKIDFFDYLPSEKNIFILQKNENKVSLINYEIETSSYKELASLPKNGDYYFSPNSINEDYLNIFDRENKTLYLFDKNEPGKGARSINNVNDWQWADNETIFFINDWEIIRFQVKSGESHLLGRFGKTLKSISTNKSENYLIFSDDQSIHIFDLKTGFTTTVLSAQEIGKLIVDNKNNLLYFFAKIENNPGVFSIKIK